MDRAKLYSVQYVHDDLARGGKEWDHEKFVEKLRLIPDCAEALRYSPHEVR